MDLNKLYYFQSIEIVIFTEVQIAPSLACGYV